MNGVQAAIFGGSAMILLVLALRLLLKKHLPRGIFPDALVRSRCAVAASDHDTNASKRLESAAHAGHSAGKRCHIRCANAVSVFGDQQHRRTSSGYRGNQPDASCLARLRDTSRGIFCDRICLHGTSVSRNTACSAAVH